MELRLDRIFKTDEYTIGELYANSVYLFDTLEDKVRVLPAICPNTSKNKKCTCKEKVYGKTAIPAGVYEVKLTYSNRFKRFLPEILNVPHFLGIRFHSGNKASETEGCILVGNWDSTKGNWVSNSRKCMEQLMDILGKAKNNKEKITLTINNL